MGTRMSDRLLTTIIELEEALQEEVRREAERAGAWRDREYAALAAAATEEHRWLDMQEREQVAAAQQAAAEEAGHWQAAADTWCARLAALSDPFLKELLRRHLAMVLPETGDDHSHGEG